MARRSRRNRRKLPTDPLTLSIDRLSHEGRGVANIDGKIAFVEGALPGETVEAVYVASRSSFDELRATSVIEPNPHRTKPGCEYYGVCGGCSLQHFDTETQLAFKQDMLLEQLCQATGLTRKDVRILDRVSDSAYHYRRKARLAVRYVSKKGGTLVGFRERQGSFITVMERCPILVESLSSLIQPLRHLIDTLHGRGVIPQIEVAAGDGEQPNGHVALVLRHLESLDEHDLARLRDFAQHHACDFYLQPGNESTIHKLWPTDTPDRLEYALPEFDLKMQFHPVDFVQVNAGINSKAIRLAIELLELGADDRVLDLFCGLGNFTLPMARVCQHVTGVEGSDTMVERARQNALHNGIENVTFHVANLYSALEHLPWMGQCYNKILLDPPRSGALEMIETLPVLGAERIVYISCNPATLARDAAAFAQKGYRLTSIAAMDMFPQTTHTESIAIFENGTNQ